MDFSKIASNELIELYKQVEGFITFLEKEEKDASSLKSS